MSIIGYSVALSTQIKAFKLSSLLPEDHPMRINFESYQEKFNDEMIIFALLEKKQGRMTLEEMKLHSDLFEARLKNLPVIESVNTIGNSEYSTYRNRAVKLKLFFKEGVLTKGGEAALQEDHWKEKFISENGQFLLFIVEINQRYKDVSEKEYIHHIIKQTDQIVLEHDQFQYYWLGAKIAKFAFWKEILRTQKIVTPLLLFFMVIILFFMVIILGYLFQILRPF